MVPPTILRFSTQTPKLMRFLFRLITRTDHVYVVSYPNGTVLACMRKLTDAVEYQESCANHGTAVLIQKVQLL